MSYEGLTLAKEGGIATLTLNRPEQMNAFSLPMIASLKDALTNIQNDNAVKAVIVTGAGRAFCAGLDISTFPKVREMPLDELEGVMHTLALPLFNLSKITIAAINGATVGAGLSIALMCDLRIASEKAKFSSAYVRMGLVPDAGATYAFPRIVGTARAMELMITGETFDAVTAEKIGLLNRVVPEAEVINTARAMAERIVKGPTVAIDLIKRAVKTGIHNTLEQQVGFECLADFACLRTEDHKEAVNAFLEKRAPKFKGK